VYGNVVSVAYGSGRFVAVAADGGVFTSSNGETWTKRVLDPNQNSIKLSKVAFGNGVFVAIGDWNRVFRSSDGVVWTSSFYPGTIDYYTSTKLTDIVFTSGYFAAYSGGDGTGFSVDGANWNRTFASGTFDSYYPPMLGTWPGGAVLMAWRGASLYRSTDGNRWTFSATTENYGFADMTAIGSQWVAVGDALDWSGKIGLSEDLGASWVVPTSVPNHSSLTAVAHGAGETVAVGSDGEILSSSNLQTWERHNLFTSSDFSDVIYANGSFVAVGSNGLVATKQKEAISKGFSWRAIKLESSEAGGYVTATIDRLGDPQEPVSLTVRTLDGSAKQGEDFQSLDAVIHFAAGETAKSIQIPIVNDGLSEWVWLLDSSVGNDSPLRRTETFSIYLAQLPDGYAIIGSEECTVSIVDDDFDTSATWSSGVFTGEELLDPQVSGDLADPDHDGLPNLLEYALGLNPRSGVAGSDQIPGAQIIEHTDLLGTTTTYKGFSFIADKRKSDILYAPQYSLDLINWNDLFVFDPVGINFMVSGGTISPIAGNQVKVSVWSNDQNSPQIFYRLLIRKR
jgi:hypothetical protein